MIPNWDKLFPPKPLIQVSSESNEAAVISAASGVHSPRLPNTVSRKRGPLFVIASRDTEGESIGARLVSDLEREGFRITSSRDVAELFVEIQTPNLGLIQTSPTGGSEDFSVVTTLTAKVFSSVNGVEDVIPMQRQALGMGATEIEACQNSIAAVTDRLGKSIAEVLR